jgi:hypothetical protein
VTFSVKHAFQSAKADGGDSTIVRPSDWNAEHDVVGTQLARGAYTSGVYHAACINDTDSWTADTGALIQVPIHLPRPGTLTRIGFHIFDGATDPTKFARLGVYEDADGQPGDLLLDAGTVVLGAVEALKEITISQAVTKPFYWLALTHNDVSSLLLWGSYLNLQGSPLGAVEDSNLFPIMSLYRSFTFGALPADESAQTYDFAHSGPTMWVRSF